MCVKRFHETLIIFLFSFSKTPRFHDSRSFFGQRAAKEGMPFRRRGARIFRPAITALSGFSRPASCIPAKNVLQ
jgi:hypothetical protein